MEILRALVLISVITICLITSGVSRPNVLFITVDDLRPQLGCYYGDHYPAPVSPEMFTPHIDNLASQSLQLMRAHSQVALCNPSRSSLLTGRRPDTTKVWDNGFYFRETAGNFTTLPQYFKENGYISQGMGKIFHGGSSSNDDDPISWSLPYYQPDDYWTEKDFSWRAVTPQEIEQEPLPDDQMVDHAIQSLRQLAPQALAGELNFFMAIGFYKPHLPFIFPARYLDYYPKNDINLPDNPYAPWYMPDNAWFDYIELRRYKDIEDLGVTGDINTTLPDFKTLELRRAYYSTVTYIDDLLGLVLAELKDLNLESNTIVSLTGDHGWSLGENAEWCKKTNFDIATHAPLMVKVPGKTDAGIKSESFAELVDIYPTLVDAAGLPNPEICPEDSSDVLVCREGQSLLPLINNSASEDWKPFVFSQFPRNGYMGYSITSDHYRYAEWAMFDEDDAQMDWDDLDGVELYDHTIDSAENINRAEYPEYEDVIREMRERLHDGWRAVIQ